MNSQTRIEYTEELVKLIDNQNENEFKNLFFKLHPTDQTDLFKSLNRKQRMIFYTFIKATKFARIFEELELEEQKLCEEELPENYMIFVLNEMSNDDVVDFLRCLPKAKRYHYLSIIDIQEAMQLFGYEEEMAGALMTTEFISVFSNETVKNVLEQLRDLAPAAETIYYLYVENAHKRLVGVVSLRQLITASLEEKIENIMLTRIKYVRPNTDQEIVTKIFKKYDLLAMPVVEDEKMVGIITVDDVFDVLEEKTDEEFATLVGGKGTFDENISSFVAAKKRAPWIILLLFFGMVKGGIIGVFEETLEQIILLAAFIPLIMDSAGNTGTQALAVVVRSFSIEGEQRASIGKIIKREFGIGTLLGLLCAIVLLIIVPIMFPEGGLVLAFIVGVSLLITLCFSTVVGVVIPFLIEKLNLDPAVASGPLVTTINDMLGLIIYFIIATNLLEFLVY